MPNVFASWKALRNFGFEGFVSIRELVAANYDQLPRSPGVYVILGPGGMTPRFRKTSTAFAFKGRNPTEPKPALKRRWVEGAIVLYIGKAGSNQGRATIYQRVRNYLRSGRGLSSSHWGGRRVSQLSNSQALRLAWIKTPGSRARPKEKALIGRFKDIYDSLPYANGAR